MSIDIIVLPGKNPLSSILSKARSNIAEVCDEAARKHASEMREDIIAGWPVDSGASRAGWQGPTKIGEAHYRLQNDYPYAWTIEYGGYPGVGDKTANISGQMLQGGVQINQGIYPIQRPAAPVRQAISKRKLAFAQALAPMIMRQSGFRGLAGGGTSSAFRGGR